MTSLGSIPIPSVSVVIPARNSASTIGRTLDSLQAQSFSGKGELILVDDHSTDQTVDITVGHQIGKTWTVATIDNDDTGLANAYNLGWRFAHSEFVIFMHPDCYVESKSALQRMLNCLSQADVVACQAWTILPQSAWTQMSFWDKVSSARYVGRRQLGFGGKFDGVKRSALEAIGGFDTSRFHGAGEDIDIAYRLRRIGRIVDSGVEVIHAHVFPPDTTVSYLLKKQIQLGQGWGAILRKYRHHPNRSKTPYIHLTKAVLFAALCLPVTAPYAFVLLFTMATAYSWKALLTPDPRVLLIPFVNMLQFAAFLVGTLQGIALGRQSFRYR